MCGNSLHCADYTDRSASSPLVTRQALRSLSAKTRPTAPVPLRAMLSWVLPSSSTPFSHSYLFAKSSYTSRGFASSGRTLSLPHRKSRLNSGIGLPRARLFHRKALWKTTPWPSLVNSNLNTRASPLALGRARHGTTANQSQNLSLSLFAAPFALHWLCQRSSR